MNWTTSGTWQDANMPRVDLLTIPYWGYRESAPFVLQEELAGVYFEISTAFVLEWETKQPASLEEYSQSWFQQTTPGPSGVGENWLIGLEYANHKLTIKTYLRSGVADIYPHFNGITRISVALADYLEVPDIAKIEEGIGFQTLISKFELGHEQRRAKGTGRRNWVLTFRKDSPYSEAIMQFQESKQGQAEAFVWRNPLDGEKYLVRFTDSAITNQVRWGIQNTFQIGLTEVRS